MCQLLVILDKERLCLYYINMQKRRTVMKIILLSLILTFIFIGMFFYGCSTVTAGTFNRYESATLTHLGFDFATGIQIDKVGVYGGDTILWNPDYATTTVEGETYTSWGTDLWWRGELGVLSSVPYQKGLS